MHLLYILTIILALHAFFSSKINTDNLLKKIALMLIIVGALIYHYELCRILRIENPFLAGGVVLHFIADWMTAHSKSHARRFGDRKRTR